ncbi:MAG: GNAT family N-acetyltransferase [Methylocystis sp.]|nr:GNAT family N-acetyltransferase [Methylocystis sp.]
MIRRFSIEALSSAHGRKSFSCGVEPLDRYLREFATQDVKRRVSNCFVALAEDGMIAGYYTFAATGIPLTQLPADIAKRLSRYELLPAGLIGRLAVDQRFQGNRLGGAMLMDAAARAARSDPAIFALLVEAKDEAAAAFYRHHGFQSFVSRAATLFLPIAIALAALGARSGQLR